MSAPNYSNAHLHKILTRSRTIALVGVSKKETRPSWFVGNYLTMKGYRVIPVNPGFAGETLFGQRVAGSLAETEGEIHMVDIFRRAEACPAIAAEAVAALSGRGLQTLWMQLGIVSEEARAIGHAAGLDVVENRCPKLEYQRLMGELRKGGIVTGIISSRL